MIGEHGIDPVSFRTATPQVEIRSAEIMRMFKLNQNCWEARSDHCRVDRSFAPEAPPPGAGLNRAEGGLSPVLVLALDAPEIGPLSGLSG
jgi:hypothetical protein